VQDKTGIDPERQQLVFEGTLLDNGRTLSEYGITQEVTLQLIPRVPLTVSMLTLPSFLRDSPYSASVVAAGGFGAPTCAVTAGSLPDGITLDPTTGSDPGALVGAAGVLALLGAALLVRARRRSSLTQR
jgi:LPXTG-motif cell wall-anchored protein